ncbi:unnamed protein product [Cunninghamella blakesleeana]
MAAIVVSVVQLQDEARSIFTGLDYSRFSQVTAIDLRGGFILITTSANKFLQALVNDPDECTFLFAIFSYHPAQIHRLGNFWSIFRGHARWDG